jgi:hypothetical protein
MSDEKIYLKEISGYKWSYENENNLKYFEVFLDNAGLNSQDKGTLVVTDEYNNRLEKEFSGFNAGVNSWLRVDIPREMSDSKTLYIETKDIVIKDGLLKVGLDNNGRWAINFYNSERLSTVDIFNKLFNFWWWWLMIAGVIIFYIKIKKD